MMMVSATLVYIKRAETKMMLSVKREQPDIIMMMRRRRNKKGNKKIWLFKIYEQKGFFSSTLR